MKDLSVPVAARMKTAILFQSAATAPIESSVEDYGAATQSL